MEIFEAKLRVYEAYQNHKITQDTLLKFIRFIEKNDLRFNTEESKSFADYKKMLENYVKSDINSNLVTTLTNYVRATSAYDNAMKYVYLDQDGTLQHFPGLVKLADITGEDIEWKQELYFLVKNGKFKNLPKDVKEYFQLDGKTDEEVAKIVMNPEYSSLPDSDTDGTASNEDNDATNDNEGKRLDANLEYLIKKLNNRTFQTSSPSLSSKELILKLCKKQEDKQQSNDDPNNETSDSNAYNQPSSTPSYSTIYRSIKSGKALRSKEIDKENEDKITKGKIKYYDTLDDYSSHVHE